MGDIIDLKEKKQARILSNLALMTYELTKAECDPTRRMTVWIKHECHGVTTHVRRHSICTLCHKQIDFGRGVDE